MNEFASKLEFEDAAKLRDEINRLKAKEVGIPKKVLGYKKLNNSIIFERRKKNWNY